MSGSKLAIEVRAARADDAVAISQLITASARQFITPDYSAKGARCLLNSLSSQTILENIEDSGPVHAAYAYLVAERDGKLMGVIALKNGNHIFHLFVAQKYHRQGVGRALWFKALAQVDGESISVNASRYALDFYRKLGFKAHGPADQPESVERDGVICYPMCWSQAGQSDPGIG